MASGKYLLFQKLKEPENVLYLKWKKTVPTKLALLYFTLLGSVLWTPFDVMVKSGS